MKLPKSTIWGIGGIAIGIVLGCTATEILDNTEHLLQGEDEQVRLGVGKFTNPLLECEVAQGAINSPKINFEPQLKQFLQSLESKAGIERIGVYYRDLNNGPTLGINQNEGFVPASLLKVPIMIALLKAADDKPEILNQKITFNTPQSTDYFNQQIDPESILESGTSYTVLELMNRMIVYSDNEAAVLLAGAVGLENQGELFRLLGVDPGSITDPRATLTVRQYAAFFRILFNASFVSQKNSELGLEILSRTKFDQGLRKGIPTDVSSAHKFGERKLENGMQHFHDCGIVYYPKHPYLICVMTQGEDPAMLENAIAEISQFVYKQVEAQYK
ncbi:class A beta-lactamase-related serine hydrolase [Patescibacteria group bacterium]|nr:class A beta-lactamase-related serine hydrolase [Patescibacteria group bacterium]